MIYVLVIWLNAGYTIAGAFDSVENCITMAKSVRGGACYEIVK